MTSLPGATTEGRQRGEHRVARARVGAECGEDKGKEGGWADGGKTATHYHDKVWASLNAVSAGGGLGWSVTLDRQKNRNTTRTGRGQRRRIRGNRIGRCCRAIVFVQLPPSGMARIANVLVEKEGVSAGGSQRLTPPYRRLSMPTLPLRQHQAHPWLLRFGLGENAEIRSGRS